MRNAVTGPSLKETFYELKRISAGPPTAAELNQAKQYLIGNTAIRLQSRGAVAALLGKYWIDGVPADHLTEEMATMQKATGSQVAQAAAKYLSRRTDERGRRRRKIGHSGTVEAVRHGDGRGSGAIELEFAGKGDWLQKGG